MPKYTHDCSQCNFVGSYDAEGVGYVDVYKACGNSSAPFIARFSSEGSDYITVESTSRWYKLCRTVQNLRFKTDLHRAREERQVLQTRISSLDSTIVAIENLIEMWELINDPDTPISPVTNRKG